MHPPTNPRRQSRRAAAAVVVLALTAAACGGDDDDTAATTAPTATNPATAAPATTMAPDMTTMAPEMTMPATTAPAEVPATTGMAMPTSMTGAADLRAGLTGLLTEHVYLAALSTGAALRGDTAAFEAFANALNGPTDSNSADIVAAVTAAYGDEVGTAFDGLWRSEAHIPAFVAYTQAVAVDDAAGADAALAELTAYATTFGETMNAVNPNLPADAVTEAITMHATTLIAVIDAQKAGDQAAVYANLREAYHHMGGTAEVLAGATAAMFPDQFDGDASSPAAALRSGLTSLLREHVLLASSATGAAIGGRQAQFEASAAALNGPTDSNTSDLVAAIASVYGDEVGTAFDGLWRSEGHIPAFVAYTQAAAAGDEAGKQAALESLTAYATTFGTTLNSVNENLPADAVTEAITMHATTLIAVIDAQAAGDPVAAAAALREAVHHMSGTADVLAEATVMKFPEQFS